MTEKLIILVVSFFIYCLMGWFWESLVLPISRHQKPYNRGFLNGPWIPIYGFGAMLVIVLFDIRQIAYPLHILFISGGVVACLLEYVTSYVMEKLFHHRWWDYSNKSFNLNGRICLEGFVCFGIFSVVTINYVQPFFTSKLLLVNENILFIISSVLLSLFLFDTIVSTHIALNIEKKLELVKQAIEEGEAKLITSLEEKQVEAFAYMEKQRLEWQKQQIVLKSLMKHRNLFKYGHRRLIRAFPDLLKLKKGKK